MSLKSFETVKKSRAARAASCLHTKVEMATFHTEVMQLLAARPYVTSSEAWAANREYPAFGTNGEYPHMTSDFQGTSPWAGTFDDGRVRFEVLDSD